MAKWRKRRGFGRFEGWIKHVRIVSASTVTVHHHTCARFDRWAFSFILILLACVQIEEWRPSGSSYAGDWYEGWLGFGWWFLCQLPTRVSSLNSVTLASGAQRGRGSGGGRRSVELDERDGRQLLAELLQDDDALQQRHVINTKGGVTRPLGKYTRAYFYVGLFF